MASAKKKQKATDEHRRARRAGAIVRLPLEVGISALNDFAIGVITVPVGLAIAGGVIYLAIALDVDGGDAFGYIIAGGVGMAGFGITRLGRAWRCRPADVVLEREGLRVDGGENHALELPFANIAWEQCDVVPMKNKEGNVEAHRLVVRDITIGEADDYDEIASLREVMDAIQYRAGKPIKGEGSTDRKASAAILSCPSCGAPIAPSADETSECGHCHEKVPMTEDVRGRVRAAAELPKREQRAAKMVDDLLDQPGARQTTIFLALSSTLIAAAWPVTAWAYVHLYRLHMLTAPMGALLALMPLLLVADGFFLSRLRLVDRRALGSIIMTFAARPPVKPGDPLTCRSCSAPLPQQQQTVVQCIYCKAANLTGLDLRASEDQAARSEESLTDALDERSRQRNMWRLRTLLSLPLFVITIVWLRTIFS